eukprot:Gb_32599 [translate_table: standard]
MRLPRVAESRQNEEISFKEEEVLSRNRMQTSENDEGRNMLQTLLYTFRVPPSRSASNLRMNMHLSKLSSFLELSSTVKAHQPLRGVVTASKVSSFLVTELLSPSTAFDQGVAHKEKPLYGLMSKFCHLEMNADGAIGVSFSFQFDFNYPPWKRASVKFIHDFLIADDRDELNLAISSYELCMLIPCLSQNRCAKDIMDRTCADLSWQIRLEVDGVEMEVPEDAEGVLVTNIGSYMGGVDLWQNEDEHCDDFDPQSMHDKVLEVVSICGTWHLGKLQGYWGRYKGVPTCLSESGSGEVLEEIAGSSEHQEMTKDLLAVVIIGFSTSRGEYLQEE